MSNKKRIDEATGVETTGHVWDGDLEELNKPLPRWWLYTFYASIVWAVGYWIVYPAWPMMNDYTRGIFGYSQRAVVAQQIQAGKDAQVAFRSELAATPFNELASKPDVLRFATASGAAAFAANCAPCHGRGAQGFPGYPNLNDDDWLWGGRIEDIQRTIAFGIRSEHKDTRLSDMPKFGVDKILDHAQLADTADYVLSLSGLSKDLEAAGRGATVFAEQCAVCHGENGQGNQELGAPNLTDAIWLYGNQKADVVQSIYTGRGGKMPAWTERLDEETVKALAIYVHKLGGGI